jgi:hypothetical protein
MKKLFVVALVLILALSMSGLAWANTAEVTQEGNDNVVELTQAGSNFVEIGQDGDDNKATVVQDGVNELNIVQAGVFQVGDENTADTTQVGYQNTACIYQLSSAIASGYDASVAQTGDNNSAIVLQQALAALGEGYDVTSGNKAVVNQDGSGNVAHLIQLGDNTSYITQSGNDNNASVFQNN